MHAARRRQPVQPDRPVHHEVRLTGTVQAVHFFTVQVPQIGGQGGRVTLTKIIANGVRVKTGDLLAEFDRTTELDNAREAQAKFDDLSHQVEQRQAQNRADAAKRASDLQTAEADLAKAELELRKGPLLSEIDRLKNEVKAEDAREHVASLKKSSAFHDQADAAAVRILELQRDRQKVSLDRALSNAEKLQIHATLDGMVALENVWRNSSMGKAQEGDQLWPGQALIRIFDPSEMEVRAQVGEPDDAALAPGCRATVQLGRLSGPHFRRAHGFGQPGGGVGAGQPHQDVHGAFPAGEERSAPAAGSFGGGGIALDGRARPRAGGEPNDASRVRMRAGRAFWSR